MSPSMFPTQHAAVLHAAKDLRLEERIVWSPKPGEVQVQIASTGLCGSDCVYSSAFLLSFYSPSS